MSKPEIIESFDSCCGCADCNTVASTTVTMYCI